MKVCAPQLMYLSDSILSTEGRDAFIRSISLVKRNALAAPFELAFKQQKELEISGSGQGQLMQIHYRDEEAIYIQGSPDRVTVIFSTVFREETDRIFGKVFLQVRDDHRFQPHADMAARNLWMHDGSPVFRMPHKFSTQTVTLHWKSAMLKVCETLMTLAMSPSSFFPVTLPMQIPPSIRYRTYSCSEIICTTTSSVQRHTCTLACVIGWLSSRKS